MKRAESNQAELILEPHLQTFSSQPTAEQLACLRFHSWPTSSNVSIWDSHLGALSLSMSLSLSPSLSMSLSLCQIWKCAHMLTKVSGSELSIYNTQSSLIAQKYLKMTKWIKVSSIPVQMYSSSYLKWFSFCSVGTVLFSWLRGWTKKVTFRKLVVSHSNFWFQYSKFAI